MVIRLLIAIMNQVDYASEEAFASANRQLTAAMERQNMDSTTRLQAILVDSPVGAVLPAIAFSISLTGGWQVVRCEIRFGDRSLAMIVS
jgi:hypothetical protein